MRPHRRQPTRLPHPWDSPGKNTGVDWHFLLQCMKEKTESEVAQSCPTLSNPMDCSPPGSSIHGIFQARVLEWGGIAFSAMPLDSPLKILAHWLSVGNWPSDMSPLLPPGASLWNKAKFPFLQPSSSSIGFPLVSSQAPALPYCQSPFLSLLDYCDCFPCIISNPFVIPSNLLSTYQPEESLPHASLITFSSHTCSKSFPAFWLFLVKRCVLYLCTSNGSRELESSLLELCVLSSEE